jgi:hypothetical protein
MPEVSRFYGIVIKIFYDDHNPPHFHAEYGEHEVLVNINTLAVLGGGLPARALGMVTEWASLRQPAPADGMGASKSAPTTRQDRAAAVNSKRSHNIAVQRLGARGARPAR